MPRAGKYAAKSILRPPLAPRGEAPLQQRVAFASGPRSTVLHHGTLRLPGGDDCGGNGIAGGQTCPQPERGARRHRKRWGGNQDLPDSDAHLQNPRLPLTFYFPFLYCLGPRMRQIGVVGDKPDEMGLESLTLGRRIAFGWDAILLDRHASTLAIPAVASPRRLNIESHRRGVGASISPLAHWE